MTLESSGEAGYPYPKSRDGEMGCHRYRSHRRGLDRERTKQKEKVWKMETRGKPASREDWKTLARGGDKGATATETAGGARVKTEGAEGASGAMGGPQELAAKEEPQLGPWRLGSHWQGAS